MAAPERDGTALLLIVAPAASVVSSSYCFTPGPTLPSPRIGLFFICNVPFVVHRAISSVSAIGVRCQDAATTVTEPPPPYSILIGTAPNLIYPYQRPVSVIRGGLGGGGAMVSVSCSSPCLIVYQYARWLEWERDKTAKEKHDSLQDIYR